MKHADFNKLYFECRDLLPDQKLKALFAEAMVGAMAVYVPDHRMRPIMQIALDAAQTFTPEPQLQLVKR